MVVEGIYCDLNNWPHVYEFYYIKLALALMIHWHEPPASNNTEIWLNVVNDLDRSMDTLLVFLSCLVTALSSISSQAEARAFFVFGDSLVDNGNNDYLATTARADSYPYGIDYPTRRATGRFSNGLNIPDLISMYACFSVYFTQLPVSCFQQINVFFLICKYHFQVRRLARSPHCHTWALSSLDRIY